MIATGTYLALTAVAMAAGFIDAVAGGGGLLTVPALLWAGLPTPLALGTNKLQSAFGTALASKRYHAAGLFHLRPNLPAVGVVLVGAAAGALAVQRLNPALLKLVVPVLLIAAALYTLFSPKMHDADGPARLSPRQYLPVAGLIGGYDGFFGPGAGQFFALSLVSLRGIGLVRATGLTKLFNLASNLASVVVFAIGGQIVVKLALAMALGSMAGAWAGSHLTTRHGARVIRPLLVTVSLALTTKLVWGWFQG